MSIVNLPHVNYEINGEVITVEMNWPEGKNAMDWQSLESMAKIYELADQMPELKLMVLKGSAGYFNTGGHVDTSDPQDKDRYEAALHKMTALQKKFSLPILAAVNGDCKAGGMMFLADADFAVSVDTAMYGFPEILHGAFPIVVMIPVIDVIPKKKALDIFCSGEDFTAQEALEMGLLSRVVPEAEFDKTVQRYIDMVCRIDKNVMRVGRNCYYEMAALPKDERTECGNRALRAVWKAKEASKRK